MKHIIIGTAGHIDHGKTTLIHALTGRNTDRWAEEQKRGITIDLGFTYFDLPKGDRVGIIDVPGHEKFVGNMVAGVIGMDMVMLVVAADEGIMPQTREHIDILAQLGIEKSVIVLNKCDLVEEEWLELVEEELKEELVGTFLENAPIVNISAATGAGIQDLTKVIEDLTCNEIVEKDIHTIPRLPIDRAFTLSGFGTVITGTLLTGTIHKEDILEMYPLGKECKIRSIQVHGEEVKTCYAGQRVAINISNVKKAEIKRGNILAPPGSMKNTQLLDVKLNILKSSKRTLENHARLHLFTGTSEVLCRAVLLDADKLEPGMSGYVQLRLEETLALRRGDKLVVRFYSPMETIGGGVVLEPNPTRKKRFQEEVIQQLRQKESGTSADVITLHVKEYADTMVSVSELAKLTALSLEEVQRDIEELEKEGTIYTFALKKDRYAWHRDAKIAMQKILRETLQNYHTKYPYRYGMKKAEVHITYAKKMKPNLFDLYLELLEAEEVLVRHHAYLQAADFTLCKDKTYEEVSGLILEQLKQANYDFIRYAEMNFGRYEVQIVDDILATLLDDGKVIRISEDMYTLSAFLEEAKENVRERLAQNGMITIAEVRDMFATSRKSAKPILEYMDSVKVTKKTGAESERIAYS